jgi:hypothetical protein
MWFLGILKFVARFLKIGSKKRLNQDEENFTDYFNGPDLGRLRIKNLPS